MNSLSWMIYLADVLNGTAITLRLIIFGLLVGFVLSGFISTIEEGLPFEKKPTPRFWYLPTIVALLLVQAVLPSKNTVYAIAASEMGEKALNTPTAGKAFKALDAWLDEQIAPEKSEEAE